MAFDVAPTSGTGPYTFTADFLDKDSFGHGYTLHFFRSSTTAGVCPPGSSADIPEVEIANSLLTDGVAVRQANVSPNFCVTYALVIEDDLGNVIDAQYVNVSNI